MWGSALRAMATGTTLMWRENRGIIMKVPKMVSFRIRRQYFDQIVAGTKTEEIRTDKLYWRKILLSNNPPKVAVFVCGKEVHRRHITTIYLEDPEKVLGRPLSQQGQQDVLSNPAIIISLGGVYE